MSAIGPNSAGFIPVPSPRASRPSVSAPRRPPVPPRPDPEAKLGMTSYRIHRSDRERLRLIAERMTQDMAASVVGQDLDDAFRKVTMSGALRVAIRNLAKELGIVVDETDVAGRGTKKGTGKSSSPRPYGAAERERELEQKRARELREARREELRPDKGLLDLDGLEGLNDPDEEEDGG